ncbi:MAG: PAS domain S-box protein [Bacteroidales bacterium]
MEADKERSKTKGSVYPGDDSLFRRMVENSRDAICITQNGMFKYVNKAFCNMLGYSEEELTTMTGTDLLASWDKERMIAQHYKRMAGAGGKAIDTTTLVRKDGQHIDIEISVNAIEYEGSMASVISSRDITERKHMLDRLEKSEQKYRMLIENARDGIIITQDGKFKFVNKALCEILEYSEDELLESDFLTVVAEDDRERLKQYHIQRMSGSRHNMVYEAKGIAKSGKILHLEINTTYLDYNDKPATFIILRDQTSRKTLEETLKTSENKYRKLFEAESDAIFLIDKETGGILDANPAASRIYGYSHEEFLGLKNTDMSEEPALTREATKQDAVFIPVRYHKKKDGSVFAVEITAGMTELENRKAQIVTVRDITQRLSDQEALRKSEIRYRRVIQSLQEGLFVIQDEKFIFVNEAIVTILGYTVEEMLGKSFHAVIPPENINQSIERYSQRERGIVGSWSYESTLLHKDGVTRIPVILSTNLTEVDGKMAVVGTAKDITDRVRAEAELINAHKRLEEINHHLEQIIEERTHELTKANTQLLKLQKENLQSQFDVLKQQVNPHFLFNSLNVLTSLIRIEPELAEKFTEHLSKVYRYVLENKDNELVNLSTELDFLDAYIFLLNIRFMGKIKVNINIPDAQKSCMVIPLALQLLIENAIKHNAMSKKSPLVIEIFIDETLYLNVVNNLQAREAQMTSTGVGLKNIQNRYLLLNNCKPEFKATSTHFIARIPLICDQVNK